MLKPLYVYVGSVALFALFLLSRLSYHDVLLLSAEDKIGLAIFAVVGALSHTAGLVFSLGSSKVRTSLAFLPLFAAAIIFPPAALMVVVLFVYVVDEIADRASVAWAPIFNVAQHSISYGLASFAFWSTQAVLVTAGQSDFAASFVGLGVMAVVFYLTHMLLFGALVAIRNDDRLFRAIQKAAGPTGSNLFFDLMGAPLSFIVAILYQELYIGGLLLAVLPILLIRYSYTSRVQLQEANRDLLRVLIKAIETRDPYTSGHSLRVSIIARTIAEDLQLPPRGLKTVETAALLHDIGKIDALYAPIIQKSSALNPQERGVIRTHAIRGADLLQNLTSLSKEVIGGVRHHHERFDGSGYPDGLRGSEIPLVARIIMLCDAIDAMLSDRPYRKALPIPRVRAELLSCSGTQFDPAIVDVILRKGTLTRAADLVEAPSFGDGRENELSRSTVAHTLAG